jgi:NAD(P)-dependent dehydrogenase (short-subunit alcohol dehydrogenase family)
MSRTHALFDLSGKHALVTGGNSGIGEAMALALGQAGARVTIVGRRAAELARAKEKISAAGVVCEAVECDVSQIPAAQNMAKNLLFSQKKVDILVNAAGVNLREPFDVVSEEAFDTHMALHLKAPFFLTQAIAPAMKANGWGRIINLASMQSYRAFANSAPYGAGKGGIVQLTRATAQAWSAFGITCNAIAPGFFPTPLTAPVFNDPAKAAANAAQTCIGRNGELEDLYGLTIFLASNASAYITGQTICCDGGFTAK